MLVDCTTCSRYYSDFCKTCFEYSLWESKTLKFNREAVLNPIPSYYNYEYKDIKLDPYRVAEIYGIKDNKQFHIFKKVLRLHVENHKTKEENIKDIIKTAERWLEMLEEDKQ